MEKKKGEEKRCFYYYEEVTPNLEPLWQFPASLLFFNPRQETRNFWLFKFAGRFWFTPIFTVS